MISNNNYSFFHRTRASAGVATLLGSMIGAAVSMFMQSVSPIVLGLVGGLAGAMYHCCSQSPEEFGEAVSPWCPMLVIMRQ